MPETIYTLDVLFGAFVLAFGVAGLLRGLAGELARLITLLLLLTGICFFYPTLVALAADQWPELPPGALKTVIALALLLGGFLVFALLRAIFHQVFKDQLGKFFDRTFGGMVGVLFGSLVGVSILCGISLMPQDRPYQVLSEKSLVGNWVCTTLTPFVYPRLIEMPVFQEAGVGGQEPGNGSQASGNGSQGVVDGGTER